MEFVITENPSGEDIAEVRQGLRQHNLPFLGGVHESEVACFTYASDGSKVVGITGRIWGHWLLVKFLWVDEKLKSQGIGSKLLSMPKKKVVSQYWWIPSVFRLSPSMKSMVITAK